MIEEHDSNPRLSALHRAVVEASVADTFSEARLEWQVTGYADLGEVTSNHEDDPCMPRKHACCICGHEPIMECYTITNIYTGVVLEPIGNVCIGQFEDPAMGEQAQVLRGIARLRRESQRLGNDNVLPLKNREAPSGKSLFSRRVIRALLDMGAFDPRDDDGLAIFDADLAEMLVIHVFNSPTPPGRLLALAHLVIERRVRPFLAGD